MGKPYGQSYLGDLSTRLQRLLGFDGDAGASFTSQAVPVILVGDATLPGYADKNGRRFLLNSGLVPATAFFFWRATADIIITNIRYTQTLAAAGQHDWRFIDPATAPGFIVAPGGQFLDRAFPGERPPLEFYTNGAATAGTVIGSVVTSATSPGIGTWHEFLAQPFCMQAGMQMGILNNGAASNPRYEIWGRLL